MGKVMTFPITAAVSGVFATVPASIPRETKNKGPAIRNGTSQALNRTWAPKTYVPIVSMSPAEANVSIVYQRNRDASHSPRVSGVSES